MRESGRAHKRCQNEERGRKKGHNHILISKSENINKNTFSTATLKLKICEAYIPKRGFLSAYVEMKLNEATKRERVLNIPCLF